MTTAATPAPTTLRHGNSYNIFILVLTIMSLAIMVLLILPLDEDTEQLLRVYDNLICVVFLIDFTMNLLGSNPRSHYFIHQRGWLDLMGSIPSLGGAFRFAGLLRLARLSRLTRIMRLMRGSARKELIEDVLKNRGQYATFITLLLVLLVLSISSILMVQVEGKSPNANITTGGDALWWSMVTITTVGYGDKYPVTELGRVIAIGVMFSGIGIIGALASILASLLVSPSSAEPKEEAVTAEAAVTPAPAAAMAEGTVTDSELADRAELTALRLAVAALAPAPPEGQQPPTG